MQTEQTVAVVGFPDKLLDSSVNLVFTQPLLRGAGTAYGRAEILRAGSARQGAERQFEQNRQDILLAVVQAYWEVVFARADYRVQFQALELAQEQLRITVQRIAVRDLAPRDRFADLAEVARRKEGLIIAENQIRQSEDELRALIFSDPQGDMWNLVLRPTSEVVPDLSGVAQLEWQTTAREALQKRPELAVLRASVAMAEQALVLADTDLWPQLDFVGSYNSGSSRRDSFNNSFDDTIGAVFPDWSLRLQFSYPFGNRAALSRHRRAQLDLEEAMARVFAEEIDVQRQVRDAVRDLKTLAESIRASSESVRLGENDLDTAQHKQRVGTLTPFDVQQRNQELQEARSRLHRNQVDFRIAEGELEHVQGKLDYPRSGGTGR